MKNLLKIAATLLGLIFCLDVSAQDLMPPIPVDPFYDSWSFDDPTNWTSDLGFAPIAYTNIICDESAWASDDGILDCNGLILDSTNAAFLNYKTVEDDGHTNLSCTAGTIWFWFSPDWDSESQGGSGPGDWGRFIDVGAYTTNAAFGWWSLLLSPDGNNIYFSGQTNGAGTNYLNAPISWTAGSWHLIGLTYTATNSILYIDDQVATNGIGVIYPPGHDVLTNGFWIGSDFSGTQQARGEFVDVESWNMIFPSDEFSAYYDEMLPELPGSFGGGFADSFGGVGGFSGVGSSSGGIPSFVDGTNLWLQITGTTNTGISQTAWFTVWPPAGVTNGVYDLFYETNLVTGWSWVLRCGAGETNLTVTNLTADNNFFRLATTNDTDGDGLSDAFEMLVSHTDPANADQNTNGIPDGWEWNYFGNLNQSATNDYDGDGNTILYDYENEIDPNIIQFSIEATNDYFNTANAAVSLNVANGVPSYYAVMVDGSTATNWTAYSSANITAYLGSVEGWHDIWIGLRGLPSDAAQTWQYKRLKLDTTPPWLVITSPTNGTVKVPLLQLEGCSVEDLDGIRYDLTNALGLVTNQQAGVTGRAYSTNTLEFTTNWFECVDVPLMNGLNIITLHATDLAGNVMTTNVGFTVDYSMATNPVVGLTWPTNGMELCGSGFTLRGTVDDPMATVCASVTDTNGDVNTVMGEVERTGVLWVENLPLAEGTNVVTLSVTNSAGFSSETNITVVKSDMTLTMDPISDSSQLWQPTMNVSGLISDASYSVWVNGVQGTNNGNGTWNAYNVPVSPGGVASFDVSAVNGGDPEINTNVDKPARLYVKQSNASWVNFSHRNFASSGASTAQDVFYSYTYHWDDGAGGGGEFVDRDDGTASPSVSSYPYTYLADFTFGWPATSWENLVNGTSTMTGTNSDSLFDWEFLFYEDLTGEWGGPPIGWEHCGINLIWDCYVENDATAVDYRYFNFHRTADTTLHLQTGGKAKPQKRNLWQLNGSATAQAFPTTAMGIYNQPGYDIFSAGYEIDYSTVGTAVPNQNITVDGQPLGGDGNQWRTYADGDDRDVTPRVKGVDYYTFNLTPTKYTLTLTASTNGTATDLSTNTPEFCVGQNVTFALNGLPLGSIIDMAGFWTLPTKYVNAYTNAIEVDTGPPECSLNYYINSDLLANTNRTSCWFVSGQGGTASVGLNLHFNNGQYASIVADGSFTVYRPSVSDFHQETYDLTWSGIYLGADMFWNETLDSKYDGQFGITQLLWGTGFFYGTGGTYELDGNSEIYGDRYLGDGPQIYTATNSSTHTTYFQDNPSAPTTSLNLAFKDYLRFQPSGSGNIFVTIATNGWSVNASVTGGVITPANIPPATYPVDNDEFPQWNTYRPNH